MKSHKFRHNYKKDFVAMKDDDFRVKAEDYI